MVAPPPAPWSYAGRAAYFGDRVCLFCDQHNRAAAQFCSGCGLPLYLKPCSQCEAVNHHASTICNSCGAAFPAGSFGGTRVLEAASPLLESLPPDDAELAAGPAETQSAAPASPPGRRLLERRFLAAYVATFLITASNAAFHVSAPPGDPAEFASRPIDASEPSPITAASAVPMRVDPKPPEPASAVVFQPPVATANPRVSKRASVKRPPEAVTVTKRANVRVNAPVAQPRKATQPDPWQAMQASLARCDGNLIARILCDQRIRRSFCEGRWGKAPECSTLVVSDRGQ